MFDLSKFDEYREDNRREVKKAAENLPVSLGHIFCFCKLLWRNHRSWGQRAVGWLLVYNWIKKSRQVAETVLGYDQ